MNCPRCQRRMKAETFYPYSASRSVTVYRCPDRQCGYERTSVQTEYEPEESRRWKWNQLRG
jgi:C4-type Zn-finger protein